MATISNVSAVLTGRDAGAISTMQRLQQESQKTAQAVEAINKRLSETNDLGGGAGGGGFGGLSEFVKNNFAELGSVGTVTALLKKQFDLLHEAMQRIGERSDMASTMGFTYKQVQALNVAASLANTTVDSLSGAFGRFLKTVAEAADGSESAQQELARLGVTAQELQGKTSFDILGILADRLNAIDSPAQRARVAMDLFGREAGIKMIEVLGGGSDSLENYKRKAEELGLSIDNTTVGVVKLMNQIEKLNELRSQGIDETNQVGQEVVAGALDMWSKTVSFAKELGVLALDMTKESFDTGMNKTFFNGAADRFQVMKDLLGQLNAPPDPSALVDGVKDTESQAKAKAKSVEDVRQKELKYAKDLADYKRRMDAMDDQQAKEARDKGFKYARDLADYRRRLDEYDLEVTQQKEDALKQATREIDAAATTQRPELFISGSAEAQRMAFISKNATKEENTRQEAIQQRANQILEDIRTNTSRGGTLTTIGL